MAIKPWVKLGDVTNLAEGYGKRLDKQKYLDHNGQEAEFFFFEQPFWSMVLPITPEGKVILVRQYKQGADRVVEEAPGGTAEFAGEEPEKVVRRELMEETGYQPEKVIFLGQGLMNSRNSHTRFHCFLAMGCREAKKPELDGEEEIELLEKPLAEWAGDVLRAENEEWSQIFLLVKALPYLGVDLVDMVVSNINLKNAQ